MRCLNCSRALLATFLLMPLADDQNTYPKHTCHRTFTLIATQVQFSIQTLQQRHHPLPCLLAANIHIRTVGIPNSRSPPSGLGITTCRTGLGRYTPSPFQAQGEISPGKDAILPRTTAGFTLPPFDHKSFAVHCPLALVDIALYPVLVHRLAVSIHASSPHSVALMQLRFTSFAVVSLRQDFHLQDCAHAGRTTKKARI